ncbi:hypothetical protein ACWDR1_20790 [Streptosporangium sandarakinum]
MTAGTTLPLLRGGRRYASRDSVPVPGPAGTEIALSLAPEIMIRDDAARLRAARDGLPPLPAAERVALLREATRLFRHGRVPVPGLGEQDPGGFAAAMAACAGLPAALVGRWSALLDEHASRLRPEEPDDGALTLVSLPANTFTCLEAVLDAALTSGAVWIRPSRREPLSSARLAGAMLAAGWPAGRIGYYPTAPAALPALVRETTRQIVYGGPDLAARMGGPRPSLDLRGPGRACLVADATPADPEGLALRLAGLAAADAGRFCTSVCTVAVAGDAGPVARALAARFDAISLDPPDPRLPQASCPEADALATARLLDGALAAGGRVLTRRPLVSGAGGAGRRAFLSPTVVLVDDPGHPLVGRELPFPFVVAVSTDAAGVRGVASRSRFVHHEPSAPLPEGTFH